MKLGFLTACLPDRPLARHRRLGRGPGLRGARGGGLAGRRATGRSPRPISPSRRFDQARADDVLALFEKHDLTLSSLAYYDNNLAPDADERRAVNEHVLACIDAAALLGCQTVGTFVGRDPGRSVKENLREARGGVQADRRPGRRDGVKVIIENCVMEGWHPDGYPGNLAYSPELWEWMFSIGLYLNYDPSHLMWIGIDPVEAVRPYVDRIPHAQAKDVELFPEPSATATGTSARARSGPTRWDVGWWRYRVPGWARSTGSGSSTPCTRAASTACCRSSTRTRSGAAPRTGSRSASRSPTGRCGRCSSAEVDRSSIGF